MLKIRRMKEKLFERHFTSAKCFISSFLVTRPYHPSYLDSPRFLISVKESGILIAIPSHIIDKKFTILVYDLWRDEIFWRPTLFPIHYAQIDDAVFSFGRLYFHGTKMGRFFICSFDFETSSWTILRYANNACLILKSFVHSSFSNNLHCLLNYCNRQLVTFKIDENNNVSICRHQTVNSPPNEFTCMEGRRNLFDGQHRLWQIGFCDGIMKKIFALNLLNYSWETYVIQHNIRFTPSHSLEFWSYFIRDNVIYCYEPMSNGTKIWCLKLNCLNDGWSSLPNTLSEIVVYNEYNDYFEENFLLCAQKVDPDEMTEAESDANSLIVDGTIWRYCNLAVKRRFFDVPRLEYFSLVVVCSLIDEKKVTNACGFNRLMLHKLYAKGLWNRCNILKNTNNNCMGLKFSCWH